MATRKNTLTLSVHFLRAVIGILLLSGPAYAQWASDSTFNNADWSCSVLTSMSAPGATAVPCGQDSTNGNLSPSRVTGHNYNSSLSPPSIFVAHLYKPASAVYDPSIQGAIVGLTYSYDLKSAINVAYRLLVFQDNTFYESVPVDNSGFANVWATFPTLPKTYTAADFVKRSGTSLNTNPDFSCNGKRIQFGYITGNSSGDPTVSFIDNWQVTINQKKSCCGAIDKSEILCKKGGGFTYSFEVTNNSTSQTQYLLLSPPPGATYTISPSVIKTLLNPGDSTTVNVTIANAAPGSNVCIDVLLADKEVKPCCKLQTCSSAPECPLSCLKAVKETVQCGSGGSYSYTVQFQNLTGTTIQQIFVVPVSPTGITVTPQVFPITLPPNGTTTLQVTITGAPPGSTVLLRFAPSGVEPQCCSTEIRLIVPKQGQC